MVFTSKNNPCNFYVYLYLRVDGTPYYCGKGTGNRAWNQHHFPIPKAKERTVIVSHNLTEHEAFLLEKHLIKKFGRKDTGTGILRNQTDGGEGASGGIRTVESKKKQSLVKKDYGIGWVWWNNDSFEKKTDKHPGSGWIRGRLKSLNLGKQSVGSSWWNNGISEVMQLESPGIGWTKGRLVSNDLSKNISERHKGKTWYNNGIRNKRSFEKPGDEWKPGFIKFNTTAR